MSDRWGYAFALLDPDKGETRWAIETTHDGDWEMRGTKTEVMRQLVDQGWELVGPSGQVMKVPGLIYDGFLPVEYIFKRRLRHDQVPGTVLPTSGHRSPSPGWKPRMPEEPEDDVKP